MEGQEKQTGSERVKADQQAAKDEVALHQLLTFLDQKWPTCYQPRWRHLYNSVPKLERMKSLRCVTLTEYGLVSRIADRDRALLNGMAQRWFHLLREEITSQLNCTPLDLIHIDLQYKQHPVTAIMGITEKWKAACYVWLKELHSVLGDADQPPPAEVVPTIADPATLEAAKAVYMSNGVITPIGYCLLVHYSEAQAQKMDTSWMAPILHRIWDQFTEQEQQDLSTWLEKMGQAKEHLMRDVLLTAARIRQTRDIYVEADPRDHRPKVWGQIVGQTLALLKQQHPMDMLNQFIWSVMVFTEVTKEFPVETEGAVYQPLFVLCGQTKDKQILSVGPSYWSIEGESHEDKVALLCMVANSVSSNRVEEATKVLQDAVIALTGH